MNLISYELASMVLVEVLVEVLVAVLGISYTKF